MPVFTGMIIIIWISQNSDLFLEENTLCVIDTSVKQKYSVIVLIFLPWNKSSSKMILFFAGWLVVGGAVFSFLLLFCVSSEIASVHLLMQNVQKRQRIRRSRPQLVQRANGAGSCFWSARCLPSVRCLGPALLSKQGMGETARHPAMPRLFGWGGGYCMEMGFWIRFQEAQWYQQRLIQQEKWFLTFWFFCGVGVLLHHGKKRLSPFRGENCGWLTEQRVSSLEWGRLITYVQKPESHLLLWG